MARSTDLSVKEDLSSRLEQIDLSGCVSYSNSLATKFMAALGPPAGLR